MKLYFAAAAFATLALFYTPVVRATAAWSPATNLPDETHVADIEQVVNPSSITNAQLEPDLDAAWTGTPRWMRGINWGGETFFGSIGKGTHFFGSNVPDNGYFPVKIEFSNVTTSICRTYRRDLGYASPAVGTFPGAAYDMTNPGSPRRLNICFVEDAGSGVVNFTWDPNGTSTAKREYVFVMSTNYDGDGSTYNGTNAFSGATSLDVVYAWWPQLEAGSTLLQSLPASLSIDPSYVKNLHGIPSSGQLTLSWAYFAGGASKFRIKYGLSSPANTVLDSVNAATFSYSHSGLTDGTPYFYRVEALNGSGAVIATSRERSFSPMNVSSNMQLLGHWNLRSTYGGIWGYTDSLTGKEYALLCCRNEGVSIIDINTMPPTEVGFMPSLTPNKDAKEVKIYRHYAVVVKENEKLQIFDLANVTNPVQIGLITPDSTAPRNAGSHNVLIDSHYAYVVGNHAVGGLEIFDIQNPALPVKIGQFQPFYYHDIAVRNDTLYAAGIYGDGIDVVNLANKALPTRINLFNYSGSGAHNMDLSADGKSIYVSDEIGSSGNWTRIFDIADLNNVQLLSNIVVDPAAVAHNCYRKDTLLYQAYYTEGVRVWSVANPASPYEVAYYDTYGPPDYGYLGCWTVYPFFASGKLVASDMQSGLYVLKLDFPPPVCCTGTTGNVNAVGIVDLSDLSLLISYLTQIPAPTLPCVGEANVNATGIVDLSDLSLLIAYLTQTPKPALPNCP